MRRVLMTPSSVGGVAKAKLDLDVAAIDPAQFLQALYQLPDPGLTFWVALREHTQKSDARHPAGLLRPRRERPRGRRAAEQRDELAPFQLIELHSVPCQPGPDCRISNWPWSVSGYTSSEGTPVRAWT